MEAVAKNDPAAAFRAATEGRAKGDPACTYLLGQMYELGRGAPAVDLKQAFSLFEEAAKAGVPEALTATARCLESGIGTPALPKKPCFIGKRPPKPMIRPPLAAWVRQNWKATTVPPMQRPPFPGWKKRPRPRIPSDSGFSAAVTILVSLA